MKILDLGCGENKVPNSIGLDNVQLPGVDVEHDLLDFPYPFENESIDKIYLRHVIEHFTIENINLILNECNRLLRKDALLIITVPHVFSISAFIDPTHRSYFTFGSVQFWDENSSKAYYKESQMKWKLIKTVCRVNWFDWKSYQLKKLNNFFSYFIEKRINKAINSLNNPSKADRIVKKLSFQLVEIDWTIKK
ncbi:MAG: class I SAM-dependent methyltransferase [Candidatus Marinimicrobia bacterium]|nr:class I SAM-dependent methyltransferase [Candidatus Neomarinimicrobiota bacterium]